MYHTNKVNPAFRIATKLKDKVNPTTGEVSGALHSISGAIGKDLSIETTSLALLAFVNINTNSFHKEI